MRRGLEVRGHEVLLLQQLAGRVGRDGLRAEVDADVVLKHMQHARQRRRIRRPALHVVDALSRPVEELAVADGESAQRGRHTQRAEVDGVVVAVDAVPGHWQSWALDLLAHRSIEHPGHRREAVVAEPVTDRILRVVRVVRLGP